jgi:hypothetical protein
MNNEKKMLDYLVPFQISGDESTDYPVESSPSEDDPLNYHPVLAKYNQRSWWQIKDESFKKIQKHLFTPSTTPSPIALNADAVVLKYQGITYKTFFFDLTKEDILDLDLFFTYILLRKYNIISMPKILFLKLPNNIQETNFSIGPLFATGIYLTYSRKQGTKRGYSAWELTS